MALGIKAKFSNIIPTVLYNLLITYLPTTLISLTHLQKSLFLTLLILLAPSPRSFFSLVQFSRSVISDSLQPHESQPARPPCPSPTPGVYSNSCPLSWWCHPTISSSSVPFFSHLQSVPASGSHQMSQFFASGGQSIGASASTSVLPVNTQDWSSLGWTAWISLQSEVIWRVFSNTTAQKCQFFSTQLSL